MSFEQAAGPCRAKSSTRRSISRRGSGQTVFLDISYLGPIHPWAFWVSLGPEAIRPGSCIGRRTAYGDPAPAIGHTHAVAIPSAQPNAFYEPSGGILHRHPKRPKLGEGVEKSQAVGGAELCRFAVEAAATER